MRLRTTLIAGMAALPAAAEAPTGVPACDAFVARARFCIGLRADAAERATAGKVITLFNDRWAGLATAASMRPRLEADCRRLLDDLDQGSVAGGCTGLTPPID